MTRSTWGWRTQPKLGITAGGAVQKPEKGAELPQDGLEPILTDTKGQGDYS